LISREYYVRVIISSFQTLLVFSSIAFLIKFPISRIWVIANVVATVFAIFIYRIALRRVYLSKSVNHFDFNYILISDPSRIDESLEDFKSLYGFTPKFTLIAPPINDVDFWLDEYRALVTNTFVQGTIIGYAQLADSRLIREVSDYNRDKIIEVILISKISPIVPRFEIMDNPTLVRVRESDIVGSGAVLKRLFDIAFAAFALTVLLPFLMFISTMVKISSPGPVLYTANRIGQNGKLIQFPKFRTMYKDADKQRMQVLGRPDEDMIIRYKNDPRITPFGKFLRRWSLDELPQLWNVLMGSMSIVGPRPILPEEYEQVDKNQHFRFIAKPGLTGLWQVTGRKEVAWKDRMDRDIAYIEDWSLAKDFILILKTLQAILKGTGAH